MGDPERADVDLVLYDGGCGLCHRFVRRVLSHDGAGRFRFAPLAGETADQRIDAATRAALPDSIVVLTSDDRVLTRSAAVRRVVDRLGRPRGLFWLTLPMRLPRPWADALYRGVARARNAVSGRTAAACPAVPAELRDRFLP